MTAITEDHNRTGAARRLCAAVRRPVWLMLAGLLALAAPATATEMSKPDRVLVKKAERMLYLMREDEILRSYPISLGGNPVGHKRQEGDMRTPEGTYLLDWRNANSDFYMSIHISYPGPEDWARARREGRDPGGMIMIHGLPNFPDMTLAEYLRTDWTDGCIAVSNSAMIDIWLSVADNTPITILP
jgi:murein L,D-transpeptidase YafK